jgi:hypothetical protein
MGWEGHVHAWRDRKIIQHFVKFEALTTMSIKIMIMLVFGFVV